MSKKRYKVAKPIQPSYKAQMAYNKAINSFIDAIERDIAKESKKLNDGIFDIVGSILNKIIYFVDKDSWIEKTIDKFLKTADNYHNKKFKEGLELIGFDEIHSPDVEKLLESFRDKNIALIKSIPKKMHDRVKEKLYDAYKNDKNLLEILEKEFGVSKNRAKLIARDQSAKLNSSLNQIRAIANGSIYYIWNTSKDERVRDEHGKLDGKKFRWSEGSKCCGHPSDDVGCRCLGRATY
jgi:SPP1 gp7 family putative phage head morphogenesis protein